MTAPRVPVFDNHFHLDPRGRGLDAVREFARAGGTHLMLVHKPYREHERPNTTLEDFRRDFDTTIGLHAKIRVEVPEVTAWVALAPHPAEFTELLKVGWSIESALELYTRALDLATDYLRANASIAMGEVGRPHWRPIEDEILAKANEGFRHALTLARTFNVAVQVHAETATPESFLDLREQADTVGYPVLKMVKHYSTPIVDAKINRGIWPSVLVGKGAAEEAAKGGTRWMMETDYMDDPRYPGAVLGPKTVPKRTQALIESGLLTEDQVWAIHAENPRKVYGVDVEL